MTRLGLMLTRARVFREMLNAGATKDEAFAYIDLMWPLEVED